MATSCIITDYVKRNRCSILFTEDDFTHTINTWSLQSADLLRYQDIKVFESMTQWDQLDTWHYRLLIAHAFNNRDKHLDIMSHNDESQPLVNDLNFLIMNLIYCLQESTNASVDSIQITRVTELDLTFTFTLTFMQREKKQKPTFQVVVDNT